MRQRYIEAGAPAEIVQVAGNLKYDFEPGAVAPDSPVLAFLAASAAPVWIAASTSADDVLEEEDPVLAAHSQLPGWRLILAPRKPERFAAAARKLGPRIVIATLGSRGLVIVTPQGATALPGFKAKVVDTTGAGDCFVGALAARISATSASAPQGGLRRTDTARLRSQVGSSRQWPRCRT